MTKKKKAKETAAKGARGFILFDIEGVPFFRIYGKDKRVLKDYYISNYDFYVKVRDKSAVFVDGKLDVSMTDEHQARKPRGKERSANGKTVMLHLLCGDDVPFARLYGKKENGLRREDEDYVLAHPDMYVEITDKDAAFFQRGKELWLDYTSVSMSTGVVYKKGKCVWASECCKKYLSEKDRQEIKEANLSEKEKRAYAKPQ